MKKTISILALILFISLSSFGQTDKKYNKTLTKMFSLSGSEETFKAAINQIMTMYKNQSTNVSEEIWIQLENEFLKTSMKDLIKMLTPVYKKHFTQSDLEKLIEFYESPIGKKLAKKTPLITTESMKIGQTWGMKIGQDFAKMLLEKKE